MNTKLNYKQAFMAGLTAAGVAAAINTVLFFIFKAAGFFTDDIFIQPNQPLTIVPVILSSVLPTLIATVVFFLLEKYTNNGLKIFSIISVILVVFSFMSPFSIPAVPMAFAISLNVLHVVVAASVVFFITKRKNSLLN